MARLIWRKLACKDPVSRAFNECECSSLATGPQQFAKGRAEGGLRDDLGLDTRRKPFGPCLVVILDSGQALFFPDKRLDICGTVFHTQFHLFKPVPEHVGAT